MLCKQYVQYILRVYVFNTNELHTVSIRVAMPLVYCNALSMLIHTDYTYRLSTSMCDIEIQALGMNKFICNEWNKFVNGWMDGWNGMDDSNNRHRTYFLPLRLYKHKI